MLNGSLEHFQTGLQLGFFAEFRDQIGLAARRTRGDHLQLRLTQAKGLERRFQGAALFLQLVQQGFRPGRQAQMFPLPVSA